MAENVVSLGEAREKEISKDQFLADIAEIRNAQQAFNDSQSRQGTAWQKAEKHGVNKEALKLALRIDGMEDEKQQILLRDLRKYLEWLGVQEQADLLEGLTAEGDAHHKATVEGKGSKAKAH